MHDHRCQLGRIWSFIQSCRSADNLLYILFCVTVLNAFVLLSVPHGPNQALISAVLFPRKISSDQCGMSNLLVSPARCVFAMFIMMLVASAAQSVITDKGLSAL